MKGIPSQPEGAIIINVLRNVPLVLPALGHKDRLPRRPDRQNPLLNQFEDVSPCVLLIQIIFEAVDPVEEIASEDLKGGGGAVDGIGIHLK